MSREQLAERAGMTPGYVEYLEERAARVPIAGVGSLARALDTSTDELLGGAVEQAPGRGRPAPHPKLETLSDEECTRLLGEGGVGRFVFTTDRGPEAVPVNYRIMDGDVVFRVAADTTLAAVADMELVSFEVDHVDEAMSVGWSVLVTGRVRRVSPDEFQRLEEVGIEPWAGGQRSVYLRIERRGVSGRRIRASTQVDLEREPGDTTEDTGRRDPREVTEEADWRGPAPKQRDRISDPHEQIEPCEDHDPHELVEELDADDASGQGG